MHITVWQGLESSQAALIRVCDNFKRAAKNNSDQRNTGNIILFFLTISIRCLVSEMFFFFFGSDTQDAVLSTLPILSLT